MADRRISKRLMDKVMSTCVTPACLYGTETLAMSEREQQRLHVDENNWVRKITRVTRADMRRMVELMEETGVERNLTERLVSSRLQGAGHVENMADNRIPKRAAELLEESRWRRWSTMLSRGGLCYERREEGRRGGRLKEEDNSRGWWKRLSNEEVKKLRESPNP